MSAYDRAVLVEILVYHYRKDHASCGCGWAELGRSHPEHVADVYEASVRARSQQQRLTTYGTVATTNASSGVTDV